MIIFDGIFLTFHFQRKYRQTLFFSSTFTDSMLQVATRFMRRKDSVFVTDKKYATTQLCEQEFIRVEPEDRFDRLVDFFNQKLAEGWLL